jgi:hypothetical protein
MKDVLKILTFLLASGLLCYCKKDGEPKDSIPDKNFLNALIELGIDRNSDGIISPEEAEGVTILYVYGKNIADMTGIEKFVNLKILYCFDNILTTLNISKNTRLERLACNRNRL